MLGLVYRMECREGLVAGPGDEKQVDDEDSGEDERSDDDVEGLEAEDALLFLVRALVEAEVGWRDVVFAVVVAVVEFRHGGGFRGCSVA
jgi:hypothetical protein